MSDPFADLISNFKGSKVVKSKQSKNVSLNDLMLKGTSSATCTSSPSPKSCSPPDDILQVKQKSVFGNLSSAQTNNTVASDVFDDFFGDSKVASSQSVHTNEASLIDIDDPATFSRSPIQNEPSFQDDKRDFELAQMLSLGLSIDIAKSYYDKGKNYEQVLEEVQNDGSSESIEDIDSRNDVPTALSDGSDFMSMASGFIKRGRTFVEDSIQKTMTKIDSSHASSNQRKSGLSSAVAGALSTPLASGCSASMKPHWGGHSVKASPGREGPVEPSSAFARKETAESPKTDNHNTLLDLSDDEFSSPVNYTSASAHISQLELSGYEEFNFKGKNHFQVGDYFTACDAFMKSLNTLPASHPLRFIALSNIIATESKMGEITNALQHIETACGMMDNTDLDSVIQYSNPPKTYREIWSKIILKKAEIMEGSDEYEKALDAYKLLISMGIVNNKVLVGKTRCQKAITPKKSKPPSQKPSRALETGAERTRTIPKESPVTRQKFKENESQGERERFQLHDKVEARIHKWINGKETDLRQLLVGLPAVLTWVNWNPVSGSELVLPKKVKVTYLKAIAKTHPDKIPSCTSMENKMLAENIFATLTKAWEVFKVENDLN
ncbi:HCL412Cp [Eremothecium sinecaudum]|uniref:HCL412Cp n=1 Tax=Eremothecium sinecaudum TaxID=45286 RepID=A0A120K1T9_9SACH|nr:HCL412Cp [Eremothecium sinecaudum]AMD19739.1 HCL412Cp [Eremothecium sinecaudum]